MAQQPFDGASIRDTFTDATAPAPRSVQYFEMLGSRSIVADGWKATTDHVSKGVADEERLLEGSRDFADDSWALFRLADDFAETHDLAADHPDVVRALEERWTAEAERNQVFPLVDELIGRIAAVIPGPNPVPPRAVYRPEGGPVPDDSVARLFGGFRLVADVDVPDGASAAGVLAAMGDWTGGFALLRPRRPARVRPQPRRRRSPGRERRGGAGRSAPVVLRVHPRARGAGRRPVP